MDFIYSFVFVNPRLQFISQHCISNQRNSRLQPSPFHPTSSLGFNTLSNHHIPRLHVMPSQFSASPRRNSILGSSTKQFISSLGSRTPQDTTTLGSISCHVKPTLGSNTNHANSSLGFKTFHVEPTLGFTTKYHTTLHPSAPVHGNPHQTSAPKHPTSILGFRSRHRISCHISTSFQPTS